MPAGHAAPPPELVAGPHARSPTPPARLQRQPYAIWIARPEERATRPSSCRPPTARTGRRGLPTARRSPTAPMGDLWVKDVAPGSTPRAADQIGTTDERPVWSPDGKTLYFNRGSRRHRDIYRKTPGHAGRHRDDRSSPTPTTTTGSPRVSPDGDAALLPARPARRHAPTSGPSTSNGTGARPFATTLDSATSTASGRRTARASSTRSAPSVPATSPDATPTAATSTLTRMNVAEHFDGNADWATNFSPTCDAKTRRRRQQVHDVALSCTDPDPGFGAAPPTPTPLDPRRARNRLAARARDHRRRSRDGKVIYTPTRTSRAPTPSPTPAATASRTRRRRR